MRERQIISENGTPVGIMKNPEVGNQYTSYVIGDQDLKLEEHSARNRAPEVVEAYQAAEREATRRVKERIIKQLGDPDDSSTFDYHPLREAVLSEDPALATELEDSRTALKADRQSRYSFSQINSSTEKLMVGSEAVLIARKEPSGNPIELLNAAAERYESYGAGASSVVKNIRDVIEKLKSTDFIGYIPQVEVLGQFRGRGHAASLIEAALWDIFQTQGLKFATAIVEDDNPHGEVWLEPLKNKASKLFTAPVELVHLAGHRIAT